MILRRPYAFLIKHFKLFHLILTAITVYLLRRTISVLQFFSSYMSNTEILYYEDYSTKLFSRPMFVLPVVMIVVIGIVLAVLIRKKKPTIFYFICIGTSIATYVLFNISMDVVIDMETEVLSAQKVGLIRDFLTFTVFIQSYMVLINFVRGIGFDIKKFDLGKDLQELETSDEDNEEVEISVNVDTNKINRNYRRSRRFAFYNYMEHQLLYNILFVIIGMSVVFGTAYYIIKSDETYSMYEAFSTESYRITIKNAYVTSVDYRGKEIEEGKRYVVLEANVNTLLEDKVLDPRNVQLVVGDHTLYHVQKHKEEFFDLGNVYMGEKLNQKIQTYLFIYELDNYLENMDILFRFAENYDSAEDRLSKDYIDVELDIKDLDKTKLLTQKVGEKLIVDDTVFKNSEIIINTLDIKDKFKISYRKKLANNEYYDSIEYITPRIDENYDKGLLNIVGTLELSNLNTGISKFTTFVERFGSLYYLKDGEEHRFYFESHVDSDKVVLEDKYYMEIKKEILDSSEAYFELRFRNKIYRYKIK